METTLNAEQESVIAKVQKLLALARGNTNENEAQAATSKAMELLAAYNLDMAVLNKPGASPSARKDQKRAGGLYSWQRDLWLAVAELNFCKYFFVRGLSKGSKYEHQIIGRAENVLATELMAEYLQDTIERLTVEYGKMAFPGQSRFIRELIAYREGMAHRLQDRLLTERWRRITEERKKRDEAATRHSHGGTALVLADVIQTEEDLNNDYIYGYEPGTTARRRAEYQARQAAAKAAADELLRKQDEWDKAHPREAALRKAKEAEEYAAKQRRWAAEDEKRSRQPARTRRLTSREERMQSHEFYAGHDKGGEIGLDQQLTNNQKGLLS